MPLSRRKRAYLVEHMGERRVAAIEEALEEKETELKAGGVAYKEVGSLRETFWAIIGNVQAADMTEGEKAVKVKAATVEVEKRINVLNRRAERDALPDSPGGRALAQIVSIRGKGNGTNGKELPDTPGGRALKQIGGA